jgi:hypothetical protein
LFRLLGKRKRRLHILSKWHSTKSIHGDTLKDVIINFIDCILYKPIEIVMYPEYLRIFPIDGLLIYYTWLTKDELEFIKEVYLNRKDYFKNCNVFMNKAFRFYGCTANFKIEHRRELVRDFVNIVQNNEYDLLYACQQLLLNPKADRFVHELHNAIQGKYDIKNLLCIYS